MWDEVDEGVAKQIWKAGAIIGAVVGVFLGYSSAGIGGALLGAVIGTIVGFLASGIVIAFLESLPWLITWSLLIGGGALFIFIVYSLWGVGRH